jgi:predicted outer membrane repeat protein
VELLEDRLAPATLMVNSTADTANPTDPYLSLREAIAIVNSPTLPDNLSDQILGQIDGTLHEDQADTILFDPAAVGAPIVLGTQLELTLPAGTATVTIDGGTQGVTVDGNNATRLMQVDDGVQAVFDHLTFTRGRVYASGLAGSGAGIFNTGNLMVSNCALSANSSNGGGGAGIYNSGTLAVTGSTLTNNVGDGYDYRYGGGALYNTGTLTVADSTIGSNSVRDSYGGGLLNAGGTVTVTDSTLSANSGNQGGGAIQNSSGTLTVIGSTIRGNSSFGFGTGIYNQATLTVADSTLSGNSGSALFNDGTLAVTNSTLTGNSNGNYNSGIYNRHVLTVIGSTLTGNSADEGGGIFSTGTVQLLNTIVAGNHSASTRGQDISGAVAATSSHNLVGVADALLSGITSGPNGNVLGTLGSPIDPRLGPLADNGGPTLTYALLPDSPARGAGSLDFATVTDQRGLPRVVDGETDLGAYQTQTAVAPPLVVASDPSGVTAPPVDHALVTFNHPMDPASLLPARFRLTGPAGGIPVTDVAAVPSTDDHQFAIAFPSQDQPGDYTLVIGAGIRDAHGTVQDNPFTVRFILPGLTGCVLTVNSSADTASASDPYLTLREATTLVNSRSLPSGLSPQILAQISGPLHAHGSDAIVFDPAAVQSPIVLSGTELDLTLPGSVAAVTIDGGGSVTVDGNSSTRLFQVDPGVQAVFDHLTLTHGEVGGGGHGGAIYAHASSVTVADCTLTSNTAGEGGGGIYALISDVTVSRCLLAGNVASLTGGGVQAENSSQVAIDHCTLTGNSSGAVFLDESTSMTISDCTLAGNLGSGVVALHVRSLTVNNCLLSGNSGGDGGGIDFGYGDLSVTNCTLTGNTATYRGGALVVASDNATISNCTLANNSVAGEGGALYAYTNSNTAMTVSDCTVIDNTAGTSGGGLYFQHCNLLVSNCTLAGNSALDGGAIAGDYNSLTVRNSILEGNSASSSGGGIYANVAATVSNSTLTGNSSVTGGAIFYTSFYGSATVDNSTLTGNTSSTGTGGGIAGFGTATIRNTIVAGNAGGDITGGYTASHSLIGGDPRLAPLGFYGGPTQTFALLPDSPARGAGDPASAPVTDQRGLPRLAGGPVDIGAFQTQTDPFLVTTLSDPGQVSGLLSLREAVNLANVLPGDNTVSFDPGLDPGTVTLTAGPLELSGSGGVQTLDGAGRFTLSGSDRSRILLIDAGTSAVVRNLDLTHGNDPSGAAVLNRGTLTLADSTLSANTAYNGGGVLNQGWLTLYGCTLAFNVAFLGAGLDNEGYLVAYNSTFVYNAALSAGGAIYNATTGTALLTSLTISRNSADSGGGLEVVPGSAVLLHNCIVAGNYSADTSFASDIAGTVDPGSSYNLIGIGGDGGLSDGSQGNLVGVADPGLTTPDFSSSQTPVFGFTADSPALGAGDATLLDDADLRLDQHGNVRTVVNIGAV